jgi:hypothetical protein
VIDGTMIIYGIGYLFGYLLPLGLGILLYITFSGKAYGKWALGIGICIQVMALIGTFAK